MRRNIWRILAVCFVFAAPPSYGQVVTRYNSLGYCQLTSLSSATALTNTAACSTGVPTGATIAEICVETAAIRYRDDGTAPTSSVGTPAAPVSSTQPFCFPYSGPLTKIQFIQQASGAVVNVGYYH